MRITVSGLPGSGTTTLAQYLSKEYGLDLISSGEVFRRMAKERNMDLAGFGELARKDQSIDRLIDTRQRDLANERDNIILEGRLSGWMVENADLKIWLSAPLSCRVQRILARDQIELLEDAICLTEEREICEAIRYQEYYDIDINDITLYHIVLNSEFWDVEQLGAIIDTAVNQLKRE